METIDLINFFLKIGYQWPKDKEKLETILKYTKTRVKPDKTSFEFTYGHEQTFFIKAVAEHFGCKNFFEIGTGRGTACYALSLIPEMEEILTVDVVPFDYKQQTAINFKPALASNADLYEHIPFSEKEKISFILRNEELVNKIKNENSKYDLCFIDGEHDNVDIIKEDIMICSKMMKDDGIIIFDDYHLSKFSVKKLVDILCNTNTDLNALLVTLSGHLFDIPKKADDCGMVIVTKREIF
jgi:predicted O-methyltransferase YrrM|tara:strand:+ start:11168 stop:11887 length:720 start_codon:yes stop_codon:yes gene_type:complete